MAPHGAEGFTAYAERKSAVSLDGARDSALLRSDRERFIKIPMSAKFRAGTLPRPFGDEPTWVRPGRFPARRKIYVVAPQGSAYACGSLDGDVARGKDFTAQRAMSIERRCRDSAGVRARLNSALLRRARGSERWSGTRAPTEECAGNEERHGASRGMREITLHEKRQRQSMRKVTKDMHVRLVFPCK